jgi:hypothetical protein
MGSRATGLIYEFGLFQKTTSDLGNDQKKVERATLYTGKGVKQLIRKYIRRGLPYDVLN